MLRYIRKILERARERERGKSTERARGEIIERGKSRERVARSILLNQRADSSLSGASNEEMKSLYADRSAYIKECIDTHDVNLFIAIDLNDEIINAGFRENVGFKFVKSEVDGFLKYTNVYKNKSILEHILKKCSKYSGNYSLYLFIFIYKVKFKRAFPDRDFIEHLELARRNLIDDKSVGASFDKLIAKFRELSRDSVLLKHSKEYNKKIDNVYSPSFITDTPPASLHAARTFTRTPLLVDVFSDAVVFDDFNLDHFTMNLISEGSKIREIEFSKEQFLRGFLLIDDDTAQIISIPIATTIVADYLESENKDELSLKIKELSEKYYELLPDGDFANYLIESKSKNKELFGIFAEDMDKLYDDLIREYATPESRELLLSSALEPAAGAGGQSRVDESIVKEVEPVKFLGSGGAFSRINK